MDKTDTTFLTVTVTTSQDRFYYSGNRAEKRIQVEAPLDLLNETAVSHATLMQMIHAALQDYRALVAERAQAEQEGEA